MAYASKDLSVLAYANGFTLWHYTTADAFVAHTSDQDSIFDDGYFNDAKDMLRVGDMIVVNANTESNVQDAGIFLVHGMPEVLVVNLTAQYPAAPTMVHPTQP